MARGTDIKSKLVAKDAGNPKLIANLKDDETKLVLGVILGIASGVFMRTDDRTGTTYEGLDGTFRAIPKDEAKNINESGKLYLPEGIFETIADQLRDPDTGEVEKGKRIQFAFEVAVVKANNPAGYSWAFRPMVETSADADPLAGIMQQAKLIAAPEKETEAAPAPEPAGKGKKAA